MSITLKSTGLPSGYRKVAEAEANIPNSDETDGRVLRVTVARFQSSTPGQADAFFMQTEQGQTEINETNYRNWVLLSVGEGPLVNERSGALMFVAGLSPRTLKEGAL